MENEWSLYRQGDRWFISHDLCSLGTPARNYPGDRDFTCSYCEVSIPNIMVVQWRLLVSNED